MVIFERALWNNKKKGTERPDQTYDGTQRQTSILITTMTTCNKCNENHKTNNCIWFKSARESATTIASDGAYALTTFIGTPDGNYYFPLATIKKASPNGLCIFASLCEDMTDMWAFRLRELLMNYLVSHPRMIIKGTPLWRWVLWDAIHNRASPNNSEQQKHIEIGTADEPTDIQINAVVHNYAKMILNGTWGGAIEMTLFAHIYKLNVHQYEEMTDGGYQRMNMFNYSKVSETKTIHVLYNKTHYDNIIPRGNLTSIEAHESQVCFHYLKMFNGARQIKFT